MPSTEELLELNRRLMEAMPGGIVPVRADGAILEANSEALRILGFSRDAATSRVVKDWDAETLKEDGSPCPMGDYPVTKAIVTGKAQPPTVIGIRRPDGHLYWAVFTAVPTFSPSGEVSGAVVTFLDITERKRNEEALTRSESLLRSVLESSPNAIATTDAEGRLLLLTKAPSDTGTRVGKLAWEGLVEEDVPAALAAFQKAIREGTHESYEARAKSGRRWRVDIAPRYEQGKIVGSTCVARDVTEMRELEARLAIADRMASIGTLVAGVAHEINNPLTYLLANLEWLKRDASGGATPRQLGYAVGALEGAERIRQVVSELRSFSRLGDGAKGPVELRPLLEGALRMAHNEIRHRAQVVTFYGATPRVSAPEGHLGQVFLNLLVNAAHAIQEGDTAHQTIHVTTGTDEKGNARVEVRDSGSGIDGKLLPRIFDPFVTTKPRGVGTGLGLYICKNVVTALGGELTVQSEVGRGSTFVVTLPPASAQTVARPHSAEPAPAGPDAKLQVLVVDDAPAIRRVVRAFLAEHAVEEASSGREAIDLLTAREFDLVLCDLVMNDLTGIDVYERLAQLRPGQESRLVFMTGGAFTERSQRFLDQTHNKVLMKPFSAGQLLAAANEAAARLRRNVPTPSP